MSILAWWAVPVGLALLTGALMTFRGRGPSIGRSFEEIERFQQFQNAMERPDLRPPCRRRRSVA